ncbi:PecA family PE domain-processing aspartic protease [Mycobacterium sp.]|uniref:PecA family PE domain-processing aspartic protease n=1 Tax=Mycobacterium sp. TaxID=1785 RepID=UPI003BB081A5
MTDRDGINSDTPLQDARARRPRLAILAGAAGACLAAAAIGSVVTAAPASADFDDLVDPIIQPLLTHVADSFSGIDTAFGADVTAWADHALAHLGSLDSAAALSSTAATADSTTTTSEAATGTAYIPITVQEDTEPSIQATVNGSDTSLLVDTGSGGLVIPWQDLGSSHWEVLRELHQAGAHLEKFGHSGYSGGVQYSYREYDGLTVDYGNGQLITTNTPVDIVWNSHGVFGSGGPRNFEEFLKDNDVTGILGIGANTAGPTESPFEATGYTGVTVDLPQNELIVGDSNPGTAIYTVHGAPISNLYETVTTNGVTKGLTVSDDVDSGGVYGTIPSSLGAVQGSTITVYSSNGGTELYSYTVGHDANGANELPVSTSGTSIDSGEIPFREHPIYIDYTNNTMSFDELLS